MAIDRVNTHKLIVKGLSDVVKESGDKCFSVKDFCKKMYAMDSRTIKTHLEIMEIDGLIKFSKDKTGFVVVGK